MTASRISGLHKLTVSNRIDELERLGWLSERAAAELRAGAQVLSLGSADTMIENVVGVFGLPLAIAPNFIVNGRDCLIPLVVEEPSIVAALSKAARLARPTGGFVASLNESLLIGQIMISGIGDVDAVMAELGAENAELIALAELKQPRLKKRGGGIRNIEYRPLSLRDGTVVIAAHILVDTCDAMGANIVNTLCESLAPRIAEIANADVVLKILSNFTDRSVCSATVRYPVDALASGSLTGEEVRDRIVLASEIALADTYRAVTHNKGVMNGIDALALATGNDWRALEAGAHAFAARDGNYGPLATWKVDAAAATAGDLIGKITIGLKPGVVGGTLSSNPGAALGLALSGAGSARELAEMMAAVGLAQNFAALNALASSGIQRGHMRLHARSVAGAAGASNRDLDDVVDRLLASGDITPSTATAIVQDLATDTFDDDSIATTSTAAGKVILAGEHAVVYGRHALALPISNAVQVRLKPNTGRTIIDIPAWGYSATIGDDSSSNLETAVRLILNRLGVTDQSFSIDIRSRLPRGMGLGSSAAIAVAVIRALAVKTGAEIDDTRVNEIAFECEKLAHGTPSGVDNTLSCFAEPILFQKGKEPQILEVSAAAPIVIGFSHQSGPTEVQVSGVQSRYAKTAQRYDAIFDQIDEISIAGAKALVEANYGELGRLLNICHGLLNSIEVSTPDLENMVSIARRAGATGAKLTGAGGGGAIIALCPGTESDVSLALRHAGYGTMTL